MVILKPGDELVSVGKIVGTYGYKGILKVLPLTDFPERLEKLKKVKLFKGEQTEEILIESVKPYKDLYLFKFTNIDNKETARQYGNFLLKIEESEIYPLPKGYFYHFELKGLAVFDNERGFLGELTDILETGANDVYVVNSEKYGEILLPAIKDVIVDINLEEKKMQVKLLPGLI